MDANEHTTFCATVELADFLLSILVVRSTLSYGLIGSFRFVISSKICDQILLMDRLIQHITVVNIH